MIMLVTGGSGCGKSAYAEKMIASLPGENRIYIATMRVYDDESVKRVEKHRLRRADMGFKTIECEKDLSSVHLGKGSVVLLEDLVNLTANELFDGGEEKRIIPALNLLARRCTHLVMVTGDVFSDGIAYAPDTQSFLKKLADVNRAAARMADCVVEVVCSLPIMLKGKPPCV